MKKMIVVAAVLLVNVLAGKAFAADDEKISREAKEAFKKEFPAAEAAKWEELKGEDLYIVRFLYEDKSYIAYVVPEGTVVASARLVETANLPFTVRQAIKKAYSYTEVLKVEELTMGDSLSYFFTIEHGESKILLRVYPDGSVQRISKEKRTKKGF